MGGELLAAGMTVGSDIFNNERNIQYQKKTNSDNYETDERRWLTQRQWDVFDWKRQNEYNSPEQQMNRLRQAGLNPHLVYGKGADNTAASVRGGTPPRSQSDSPKSDFHLTQGLGYALQAKLNTAQIDQVHAQTALLGEQAKNTQINSLKTASDTEIGKWQNSQEKLLAPLRYQEKQRGNVKLDAEIENTNMSTDYTRAKNEREKDHNAREWETQPLHLDKLRREMLQIDSNVAHQQVLRDIGKQEEKLKKYESLLRSININPNANDWVSQLHSKLKTSSFSEWYYGELYDIYHSK